MVGFKNIAVLALGASPFFSSVTAHPGEVLSKLSIKRQAALTQDIATRGAEKLARCADSINARALRKRASARRAAKAKALMRRLSKRTSTETEAYDVSHNETGSSTSDEVWNTNTSCILEPQLTIGPYWVEGELIRQDPTEDQEGVPMELDLQFVDINTCEAVSGLYIDIWNANSTGYYSGVSDYNDLDETFLRAIQITDDDGVVTFDTLVPGHYQGRAVHTHVMVHQDVTVYDNDTYAGGTVRSISQLFYDSELRAAVEEVEPYASNTNSITTNEEDSLLSAITLGDYDPFLKYIYVSDDISDGIFAWHSIGIDLSANYTSNEVAAAHYYETGGVSESSSSSLGGSSGSGGPGGNSTSGNDTMPSGASGSFGSGIPAGTGSAVVSSTASASASTTTIATATYSGAAAGTKIGSLWSKSKASGTVGKASTKTTTKTSAVQGKTSESTTGYGKGSAGEGKASESYGAGGKASAGEDRPSAAPSGRPELSGSGAADLSGLPSGFLTVSTGVAREAQAAQTVTVQVAHTVTVSAC